MVVLCCGQPTPSAARPSPASWCGVVCGGGGVGAEWCVSRTWLVDGPSWHGHGVCACVNGCAGVRVFARSWYLPGRRRKLVVGWQGTCRLLTLVACVPVGFPSRSFSWSRLYRLRRTRRAGRAVRKNSLLRRNTRRKGHAPRAQNKFKPAETAVTLLFPRASHMCYFSTMVKPQDFFSIGGRAHLAAWHDVHQTMALATGHTSHV